MLNERLESVAVSRDIDKFRQYLMTYPNLLSGLITESFFTSTWPNIALIDENFADWLHGRYVSSQSFSSDVLDFNRFFGQNDRKLHAVAKLAVQRLYDSYDLSEFGRSLVDSLDLVDRVFTGRRRRTGEPVARHFDRVLLRKLAACHLAQENNSDSILRPYEQQNIFISYTSMIADVFHDLEEDLGVQKLGEKAGYRIVPNGKNLEIWQGIDNIFSIPFPDYTTVNKARIMITAYTAPTVDKHLVVIPEGDDYYFDYQTLTQVVHFEDNIKYLPQLEQIQMCVGKTLCDRADNMDTDDRPEPTGKILETGVYLPDMALIAWGWQYGDKIQPPTYPEVPPEPLGRVVLRQLGVSPDELYQSAILACQPKCEELNRLNVNYVVVVDPFQPVIITETAQFFPIIVSHGLTD